MTKLLLIRRFYAQYLKQFYCTIHVECGTILERASSLIKYHNKETGRIKA